MSKLLYNQAKSIIEVDNFSDKNQKISNFTL